MVPLMDRQAMTFSCVQKASDEECMVAIRDSVADMRTFAAAQIYTALMTMT